MNPLNRFKNLTLSFSEDSDVATLAMAPRDRPCFTQSLLSEIKQAQNLIDFRRSRYLLFTSALDGIFNYGGDVANFRKYILEHDSTALYDYMAACIDVLHPNFTNTKVFRVAVVQGAAYGGGFEAALCCDRVIAEKQARFAFPELKFNLFPGMGAYTYLSRKTSLAVTDKIIQSGVVFSAEELLELGVIDEVVDNNEGTAAAQEYIRRHKRHYNGYNALRDVANIIKPLTREELMKIGEIWVEYALNITSRDLRLMDSIAKTQQRNIATKHS